MCVCDFPQTHLLVMEVSYVLKTGGDIAAVDFNNCLDQIKKLLGWGSEDGTLDRGFA